MFTIYTLKDPITGEVRYIGQTTWSTTHRLQQHRRDAKAGKPYRVYNWFRKIQREHGCDPRIETIFIAETQEQTDRIEKWLIDGCRSRGLDLTNTREGGRTGALSESTKQKIGNSNRGRVRSEEVRQKNREAHLGQRNSVATRLKMSIAQRKRLPPSEETRQKLRLARLGKLGWMKGRRHTEEAKQKMRLGKLGKPNSKLRGYKHTEEAKRKISQATKARWASRTDGSKTIPRKQL